MRSVRYLLLLLCTLFFNLDSFGQLKLVVGESFLQGLDIKKVFVSIEDHTVWALTHDGKVYFKKEADPDFLPYGPTSQLIVEEVTGYNQHEMYFLIKPDLIIHFKLGLKIEIKVPYPEVTRINNIAIVNDQVQTPYYQYYPTEPNKNYLAIATNKHMYKLFRGDISVTETFVYFNVPFVDQPEWRITNSGNFSANFQYFYTPLYCNFQPDRTTVILLSNFPYVTHTAIPDNGAYPSKINTTLYSQYYIDPKTKNSDYTAKLSFWGTDDGLYLKLPNDCPTSSIEKLIPNAGINDLEEMHALSPLSMQNFVFAATNKGVYYTPASIFSDLSVLRTVKSVKFSRLNGFPEEKVNSICIDAKKEASIDFFSGTTYDTMCEKVIWVASVSGVKKVYGILDQEYYKNQLLADLFYSIQPTNASDYTKAVFEICGNQSVKVNTRIPQEFDSQLLIQWYKDGVELPQLIGKKEVTLTTSGNYHFTAIALCEGIKLTSISLIVRHDEGPNITFNHPSTINICGDQSYVFQTQQVAGYTYRWFRDNVQITNATQNSYTANTPGNYRVEVSSCSGVFEPSSTVKLNVLPIVTPQLTTNKANYCINETAVLSVNNPQRLQTKWYLNQTELTTHRGKDEIQVTTAGSYHVSFLNAANCEMNSVPIPINFVTKPVVSLKRSSDKALCPGESVLITATGTTGVSYLWNTGETTASITAKTAGKYKVVVSINGNCSVTSEEIEVFYSQVPNATMSRSSRKTLCDGETVQLSVPLVPQHTYLWSNGETTNAITVNKSGNYKVKVYNGAGCFAESANENVMFNNLPALPIPPDVNICIDGREEIMLQAPKGFMYYTWNGSKTTNSFIKVKQAGLYTLEVEDENGCKASTSYQVLPKCLKIFGPNTFSPNGDGVNDVWNVHGLENDPTATVIIYNRLGTKVHETSGSQAFWDGKSKKSAVAVGVYYFVIKSKNSALPITGSLTLIK